MEGRVGSDCVDDDDDVTRSPARGDAPVTAAVRPLCNLSLKSGHETIFWCWVVGRGVSRYKYYIV